MRMVLPFPFLAPLLWTPTTIYTKESGVDLPELAKYTMNLLDAKARQTCSIIKPLT